ncbi:MAG TPA: ABC transporter permease [Ktedonosporobacter sp.]|jgi:ABC-type multidrug transport system permease subunit|nr:ABC transporter permease [Ktedonosporobacter sp.]
MVRNFVSAVWAIFKKDLRIWLQQPANLAATFVPSLAFLVVMAFGAVTVGKSPVALVTLDHGLKGVQLRQIFHNADVFRITDTTPQEAQQLFKQIQVVAIVTIPADFTQRVETHQQVPIDVQVNNLNLDFTNDIRRAVPDVITQFYDAQGTTSAIKIAVQEQDLRSQDIALFQYSLLPIIVLLLTMSSVFNSGLATAREWETLTVKELLFAPVNRGAIIVGKILAGFVTTFILGIMLLALGNVLGWVHMAGIYLLHALIIVALISFMGAGLGVAMGALVQRLQPVIALGLNAVFTLFFLAGGIGVLAFAQQWLQNIAAFVPLSYGRHALEMAIFYNSSDLFGRDVMILAGSALAALALGVVAMQRKIAG